MASNFKFKLLSQLAKKRDEGGFTLIELLVVVIIIGVLAAVALPNLLGQVGKARESEAKSTVGAINRAQQTFFTENSAFATDTVQLEVPAPDGNYYSFAVGTTTATLAPVVADALNIVADGTRAYAGATEYVPSDRSFLTVVCRGDGTAAADSTIGDPSGGTSAGCPAGSTAVK